jgi:uncharacterized protein (DUF58 family)
VRPRTLLILAGIILFLGLATGFSLTFRLGYVILLALGLAFVWRFSLLRGVTVERSVSTSYAQVGDSFTDQLTVYNRGWLHQFSIRVDDQSDFPGHSLSAIISVPPHSHRGWFGRAICRRRGVFRLGPVDLIAGDPFGLYQVQRRALPPREIIVYPRPVALPNFQVPTAALPGEGHHRKPSHQPAPNAFTIRDYVNGDSFNRIHWPSTARLGRLIVKEYELDPVSDLWIVLDGEAAVQAGSGPDSTEEHAVTIAASVGHHFIERNRAVGLITSGRPAAVLPTDRGDRQWAKILQHLAIYRATGTTDLANVITAESGRFGRTSTLIVITSSTHEAWVPALEAVVARGVRVAVILLEPATFGVPSSVLFAVSSLAGFGIPTFLVKQGDDIARALSIDQLDYDERLAHPGR